MEKRVTEKRVTEKAVDEARKYQLQKAARSLRRSKATPAEKRLRIAIRRRLKGRRIRFQQAIEDVCIVDFGCARSKLAVELDGGVHASKSIQKRDEQHQRQLEDRGWTVLRFTNFEVLTQLDRIIDEIERLTRYDMPVHR